MKATIQKKKLIIEELGYKVNHLYNPRVKSHCRETQTDPSCFISNPQDSSLQNKIQSTRKHLEANKNLKTIDDMIDFLSSSEIPVGDFMKRISQENLQFGDILQSERIKNLEKEVECNAKTLHEYESQFIRLKNTIQDKENCVQNMKEKLRSNSKQIDAFEALLSTKNIGLILAADRRQDAWLDSSFTAHIKGFNFCSSSDHEGLCSTKNETNACRLNPLHSTTNENASTKMNEKPLGSRQQARIVTKNANIKSKIQRNVHKKTNIETIEGIIKKRQKS